MLADSTEYLFDHVEDPYPTRNLVGDTSHRGTYEYLKEMMDEMLKALNDPRKPTRWYEDRWTKDRVIVRSATRELEPEYRPENISLPHLDSP